jgi:hypothetical protein
MLSDVFKCRNRTNGFICHVDDMSISSQARYPVSSNHYQGRLDNNILLHHESEIDEGSSLDEKFREIEGA